MMVPVRTYILHMHIHIAADLQLQIPSYPSGMRKVSFVTFHLSLKNFCIHCFIFQMRSDLVEVRGQLCQGASF